MPNIPLTEHALIGTTQTYRPNSPNMTHRPARDYVVRNGDTVTVLQAFHDWNGVEGLTVFYVSVPATGHRTHLSATELGIEA